MFTPGSILLPVGTGKTLPVAVYSSVNGRWSQLVVLSLEEAIVIYYKGQLRGKDFWVFPINSAPIELERLINRCLETSDSSNTTQCQPTWAVPLE